MPAPQRLLSVRNKIYILKPLPENKHLFPFNGFQALLGVLSIGTLAVLGYGAVVFASLFNPTSLIDAANTNRLPPISNSSGSPIPEDPIETAGKRDPLIPPTNANQRSNQVQAGRKNPFMAIRDLTVLLPGQVRWKSTPQPTASPITSRESSPKDPNPKLPIPVATIPPVAIDPISPNFPPPPFPNATPSIASNSGGNQNCDVQVNGVIQTNGQPMVVLKIKSDEKSYSRPVRIGDRICNGAVGVRNIIGLGGPQPMVVLDQNGREMMRSVDTNLVQEPTPAPQ